MAIKLTEDQRLMRTLLAKHNAEDLQKVFGYSSTRPLYNLASGRTKKISKAKENILNEYRVTTIIPKHVPSMNDVYKKQRDIKKRLHAHTSIRLEEYLDLLEYKPGTHQADLYIRLHNLDGVSKVLLFDSDPTPLMPVGNFIPNPRKLNIIHFLVKYERNGTIQYLRISPTRYLPIELGMSASQARLIFQEFVQDEENELYRKPNQDDEGENFLSQNRSTLLALVVRR